jgi:competence protein ComEC
VVVDAELVLTLLAAVAFCGGVILGTWLPPGGVWAVGMAALALAAAAGAWGPWRRAAPRLSVVAALAIGSVRAAAPWGPETPVLPRGEAPLEVEVAAPGRPGAVCVVELSGAAVLELEASTCAFVPGERLLLPARALRGDLGPTLPGDGPPVRIRAAAALRRGTAPVGFSAVAARERARAWAISRGDPALALVVAGVSGLQTALPPEDRQALRAAGLGHLVAVSGLNVAVAAILVHAVLLRVGSFLTGGARTAVLAALVPVVGYVVWTGAPASVVRAAGMFAMLAAGTAVGRPAHGPCSLALVAAAMLAYDPRQITDPGFQMSVAAMAGLVTAPPKTGIVGQTWRVTFAVLPFSWWHFGNGSPWGVVGNLLAIPVFSLWVLPLGFVGWFALEGLGPIALAPARAGADLVLLCAHVLARLPQPSRVATLAGCGALTVLVVVTGVASRRHPTADRIARAGILPPWPALLAAVVVLLASAPGRAVDPVPRWHAVGGPRSLALIAPSDRPGIACLRVDRDPALHWPELLDALGIAAVARIDAPAAPHVAQLRDGLAQAGLVDDALPVACRFPDPQRGREALDRCLARRGTDRGIVRGRPGAPEVECFAAGAWRLLPSMRP